MEGCIKECNKESIGPIVWKDALRSVMIIDQVDNTSKVDKQSPIDSLEECIEECNDNTSSRQYEQSRQGWKESISPIDTLEGCIKECNGITSKVDKDGRSL